MHTSVVPPSEVCAQRTPRSSTALGTWAVNVTRRMDESAVRDTSALPVAAPPQRPCLAGKVCWNAVCTVTPSWARRARRASGTGEHTSLSVRTARRSETNRCAIHSTRWAVVPPQPPVLP